MATIGTVSPGEYLDTSYRPDREYVDGTVLERNVGKNEHSRFQNLLAAWFTQHEEAWALASFTAERLQVSPTRVRVPDILLVPVKPHPQVLFEPPVLVVEILSPADTYADTQIRAEDYVRLGVAAIWVIDPTSRTGRMSIGDPGRSLIVSKYRTPRSMWICLCSSREWRVQARFSWKSMKPAAVFFEDF